jgi:hypothetical protein
MGSRVLIVVEVEVHLQIQTKVRFRQIPDLKKVAFEDIFLALFPAPAASFGSRLSMKYVETALSTRVPKSLEFSATRRNMYLRER